MLTHGYGALPLLLVPPAILPIDRYTTTIDTFRRHAHYAFISTLRTLYLTPKPYTLAPAVDRAAPDTKC